MLEHENKSVFYAIFLDSFTEIFLEPLNYLKIVKGVQEIVPISHFSNKNSYVCGGFEPAPGQHNLP